MQLEMLITELWKSQTVFLFYSIIFFFLFETSLHNRMKSAKPFTAKLTSGSNLTSL